MASQKLNIFIFISIAALWGGSFVAIKEVISTIEPIRGAFLRVLIGVATMFLISLFNRTGSAFSLKLKLKSMVVGVFSIGIPFSFLFTGEKYISAGLAGVLNGTVPIWTLVIALTFVPSERVRVALKTLGALLGFLGIIIISWPSLQAGAYQKLIGVVLLIGMAMSYAIGTNLSKMIMKAGGNPQKVSLYQHASGLLFLLIVTWLMEGNPFTGLTDLTTNTYIAIGYMGIFSTGIAFTLFFYLMKEWSATQVSSVTFIIPIFSLVFDYFFFQNIPNPYDIAGTIVIFLSMFVVFSANKPKTKVFAK